MDESNSVVSCGNRAVAIKPKSDAKVRALRCSAGLFGSFSVVLIQKLVCGSCTSLDENRLSFTGSKRKGISCDSPCVFSDDICGSGVGALLRARISSGDGMPSGALS